MSLSNIKLKDVKLIYDKYENDIGVLYDENNELEVDKAKILDNLPTKISRYISAHDCDRRSSTVVPVESAMNDIDININRQLTIYTWGLKKDHASVDCNLIFDLTRFQSKIDKNIDVKTITGLSDIIQDSIIRHPKFLELVEIIISRIETDNPLNISFICNHGKHRSVAWGELIKKLYYHNATIKHLCQKHWF